MSAGGRCTEAYEASSLATLSGQLLCSPGWRTQAHQCLGAGGFYYVISMNSDFQSVPHEVDKAFGLCAPSNCPQRDCLELGRSFLLGHVLQNREILARPPEPFDIHVLFQVVSRMYSRNAALVPGPWPQRCAIRAHGIEPSECRFLDHIEERRFWSPGWRWPCSPRLLICAGAMRSGSTWLYNALRLMYRQALIPLDSYFIEFLTEEKVLQRFHSGAHQLVKTHDWHDASLKDVLQRYDPIVVVSRRSTDEVVASFKMLNWSKRFDYEAHQQKWLQEADLIVEYASIISNPGLVLHNIAKLLGFVLSHDKMRELHIEIQSLPVPHENGVINQTSKLLPKHISKFAAVRQSRDNGWMEQPNVGSCLGPNHCEALAKRNEE